MKINSLSKDKKPSWFIGPVKDIFGYEVELHPPGTPTNLVSKFELACVHILNYETKKGMGIGYSSEKYIIDNTCREMIATYVKWIYYRNEKRFLQDDIPGITTSHIMSTYVYLRHKHDKALKNKKTIGDTKEGGFFDGDTSGVIVLSVLAEEGYIRLSHTQKDLKKIFTLEAEIADIYLLATYPGTKDHWRLACEDLDAFAVSGTVGCFEPEKELLQFFKNHFEIVPNYDELVETIFNVKLEGSDED